MHLWGLVRGDDKSPGKRRFYHVLAQPQPHFGLSWWVRQPAFGRGHGRAGVKWLQPFRQPDLFPSLAPWQSALEFVCPT